MKLRYSLVAIAGPILSLATSAPRLEAATVLGQLPPDPVFFSSLPPAEPAILGWNSIDVHVDAPGYPAMSFSAVPETVPGFPTWEALTSTPFGGVLFVPLDESAGQYIMAFVDVGLSLEIDWNALHGSFDGTAGSVSIAVNHTALDAGGTDMMLQGEGPCVDIRVTEVPRPGGNVGIRIEVEHPAECTVDFYQFFTQSVTYAAGGPCVLQLPGTPGGTGNNGEPTDNTGERTYSDSCQQPIPLNGKYPAQPPDLNPGTNPPTRTTAMEDAPKLSPDPLTGEELHDWITKKNGDVVTKINVRYRFTTYVLLTCPGSAPDIVGIVEWSHERTYEYPPPAGGQPGGELGGPCPLPGGTCGFPNSSPVIHTGSGQSMAPDHCDALAKYQSGNYEGTKREPGAW
ncbi:MAG: hypothetical protein IPJ19_05120 [Planctomycetes bacterium]|nr:hypothetical protein [Planctomycetota bacterium]